MNEKLLIIGFVWPEPKSSAAGSRMMQLIHYFQSQNSRENFWVFASHQLLAAIMVGGFIAHRFLSRVKPDLSNIKKGAVYAFQGVGNDCLGKSFTFQGITLIRLFRNEDLGQSPGIRHP